MTIDECRIKELFLFDFKKSRAACGVHATKALQEGLGCVRDRTAEGLPQFVKCHSSLLCVSLFPCLDSVLQYSNGIHTIYN